MQDLKPQMDRVRSQFQGNPQKQREEMAKVYQEAGVNPLGGCLPILVQMPIFIGIFYVIRVFGGTPGITPPRYESFREGGILWFQNLSAMDGTYLLPIISAVTMLATLVTMADGLNRTGFVRWFAEAAADPLTILSPTLTAIALVIVYFFSHYLFASITAHVGAMMPIMLSVGAVIPNFPLFGFAMLLALSHGLMGVLTPYATTSGPVYLGSGYITSAEFWRLGFLFGCVFLGALLALSGPWLLRPSFGG